jgi:uncharacterized protein YdhG (YjbR/CyaY superfamily)
VTTRKPASETDRARDVDKYLAGVPEEMRTTLEKLRQTIKTVVPKATEIFWHQIPTFRFEGRALVGFAAFKNHCSLFPMSYAVIRANEDALKPYFTSKGTIRFTAGKPLPAALVKRIVKARVKENKARTIAAEKKRSK